MFDAMPNLAPQLIYQSSYYKTDSPCCQGHELHDLQYRTLLTCILRALVVEADAGSVDARSHEGTF